MDITDPQPQSALTVRMADNLNNNTELSIDTNYKAFLELLKEETDIRILVHTAGGTGHQSSAITILHLITRLWRNIDMTRHKEKTVHLIYQTDINLDKLCKTEPRLEDKEPVINHIRVVLEKDLPGLLSWTYRFGFACGYDDPDNLAKKCKVQYFLKLQPIFWRHPDEIHYNDWGWGEEDETTHLLNYEFKTKTSKGQPQPVPCLDILNIYPDFRCLGFYHQLPVEPEWQKLQNPAADAIRTIIQGADTGKFEFCITYSIGEKTVFFNKTSEIIFNLTSGFACSKNLGSIQKNHVVILNFTRGSEMLQEEIIKIKMMLLQPAQRKAELEKVDAGVYKESIKKAGVFKDSILNAEKYVNECGIYQQFERARLNFHCLDIGDGKLDEILVNNDSFHVILVNIPERLPKEVFDFCLTKVTLFSVFEGSGSASIAVSVGKPYLKYNALYGLGGDEGPHYLYFHDRNDILSLETAGFCQKVANSTALKFSDWVNIHTSNELPCFLLPRFIELYKTGTQPLLQYFQAARTFYTRESNTRIHVALGTFHILIKNKEARKNTGIKLQ